MNDKQPRRHYHVLQGMQGGYLPDLNWPVRTRKAAERVAAELARQWRQEWDEDDDGRWWPVYRVTGSARQGLYTIERREPECLQSKNDGIGPQKVWPSYVVRPTLVRLSNMSFM